VRRHPNSGREERDVEQELCKRALRRNIAAPDVDRIGKRLKGIEGDADGQRDLRDGDGRAENRVQVLHEKARVFEYRQTAEIQYQRKNQKNLFPPALDEQAEVPVDRGGGDH
jgi:hypothetical protein